MAYAPHVVTLQTPVGSIVISGDEAHVTRIHICAEDEDEAAPIGPSDSPVMQAMAQLRAYFDGVLRTFDLPLVPLETPR